MSFKGERQALNSVFVNLTFNDKGTFYPGLFPTVELCGTDTSHCLMVVFVAFLTSFDEKEKYKHTSLSFNFKNSACTCCGVSFWSHNKLPPQQGPHVT